MSYFKITFISILSIIVLISTSCNDDDIDIPNEGEIITTLTYTLISVPGGDTVNLTFEDLDGDNGNPPVITGGTLMANTVYSGSLQLLNESASPAENINTEIEDEGEDHQFFFSTSIADLSIQYSDADMGGKPLGLATTVTTGNAGTGTLTVILRHKPDKSASGVADGDISNAGGDTDIEVQFDVEVQ